MKLKLVLFIYLIISNSYCLALDIDVDNNNAVDVAYGGTNLNDLSTDVQALLDDANFSTMRTSLGLAIGTNVQAYDADLDAASTGSAAGNSKFFGTSVAGVVGWIDQSTISGTSITDGTAAGDLTQWDGNSWEPISSLANMTISGGTATTMAVWDSEGKLGSGLAQGKALIYAYNRDTLSDTSSPHGLIATEVSGTVINNYAATPAASEYDLPAAATGYNFILILGVAQNVTIDPNGSEVIYLNGAALAAGEAVVNTSPTIGESITCFTFQTGASAWAWSCKSSDTDFGEETP